MNDLTKSFIRQGLTFAGTILVNKGIIDAGTASTAESAIFDLIGAGMVLFSVAWAYLHHASTVAVPNAIAKAAGVDPGK